MDAIILAGGFGTRLAPLTDRVPKPLLPVGNRPFLETLFFRLKAAGTRRVHLSVFHQASKLLRALPSMRKFGLSVRVVQEPQALGTGGAIAYAWPDRQQACLVLNGDILSDFDIKQALSVHKRFKAVATLWAIQVPDTRAFGVIESGAHGKVLRFVEKPRAGQARGRWINAGLYVLEPRVLDFIAPGRCVSVEREVFPTLLNAKLDLRVVRSARETYWNDIGTPQRYATAQQAILRGQIFKGGRKAVMLWGRVSKAKNLIHPTARVAKDAVVYESVVGPVAVVGPGASVKTSVLLSRARVEKDAQVQGAILAERSKVGRGAHVGPGTVLGYAQGVVAGAWF